MLLRKIFLVVFPICIIVAGLTIGLSIWYSSTFRIGEDIIVELPNGRINGSRRETFYGKSYYSFQKIPFAAPPIGNLRFKDPVSANSWNGTLDASQDLDVICWAINANYSGQTEDCLYLNIYTPELPNGTNSLSYPVIFYIYGDVNPSLYGPQYFMDYGVVIVVANYRVGPFGFLSTNDEAIPGNFGLKDQLLALNWTRSNIARFGGNPNQISLCGHNLGATYVSYHLLRNNSKGLFQNAQMHSGSSLMQSSFVDNSSDIAFSLARNINNSFVGTSTEELLKLLQSVPAEDIIKAGELRFGPVIEPDHEGAIVTGKMYSQFQTGDFIQVPLLAGFSSEEAISRYPDPESLKTVLTNFDNNLELLVPRSFLNNSTLQVTIGNEIRNLYTNGTSLAESLESGIKLLSDQFFNRAIAKQSKLTQDFVETYFYQFSYDGPFGGISSNYNGVGNTEEINYLWFKEKIGSREEYPPEDQITSIRLLRLWTNFAKFGNPTPKLEGALQNILWLNTSSPGNGSFLYLNIDRNLELRVDPKKKMLDRWDELFENFGNNDFYTY